ncbi:DedA family protein [Streptomyces sp. NPDC006284]|uniref:DedA family protein n=1 Tax=Streptomyces sp. NPDC006284 TaxID=3156742 RepID=UPI0033AB4B68
MTAIAVQTAASGGAAPEWINDLMDRLGAPGAGLAIALENLFPPLPSEVILPLAGFAASSGRMNLIAVLLWTTAGSVIGALALYGVGALLGRERTVAIAGKLPLVKISDIEKTEAWFQKHGTKAVFFGRMIPIFRSLISVPAGVERMRLPVFLALTTLGSAIWNTVFVLAGYALGDNWSKVSGIASTYSKVILALAALALLAFVVRRLMRPGGGQRRRGRVDGPDARPSADDDRPGTGEGAGDGSGEHDAHDGGVSDSDAPRGGTPGGSAHPPARRARARR